MRKILISTRLLIGYRVVNHNLQNPMKYPVDVIRRFLLRKGRGQVNLQDGGLA